MHERSLKLMMSKTYTGLVRQNKLSLNKWGNLAVLISDFLKLITKLPPKINNFLLKTNILKKATYGKSYINYKHNVVDKNHFQYNNSSDLLHIINDSIKNVPYYSQKYGNKKFHNINDFQTNFEFIDKTIVMSSFDSFTSKDINFFNYIEGTTGGTSGKPLRLIIPKNRYVFELATMHSLWKTTGWDYHTRAVIRNTKLPSNTQFLINPITKEFIFDGFRLTDDYFEVIYKTIQKYNIQFIHAYPSTSYQFCIFLRDKNKDVSFIKAILSGSENILEYQKELIENSLGIRFYNFYGHSEKLVLGGYCKHTDHYHMEPTYGFFELIDDNENVITTPGEIGEIVGTTLHNYGMPLLRYKTGDYAEYVGHKCVYCSRELPLIRNIKGRWNGEKIYNKDRTYVTTTALNLHNDLYSVINGHQCFQNKYGIINIIIIKAPGYTNQHEQRILQHYRSKLNTDMIINIKYVNKLTKQPNGKFLHLVSDIK